MKTKKIVALTVIIVMIGLISVYTSSHIWAFYKYDDAFYYLFPRMDFDSEQQRFSPGQKGLFCYRTDLFSPLPRGLGACIMQVHF